MSLKRFNRIQSNNQELNRIQSQLEDVLQRITDIEILNGRLIEDIQVNSSTSTIVEHGLDRSWRGFIITNKDTDTNIWADPSNQIAPKRNLILDADATAVIDIWIF